MNKSQFDEKYVLGVAVNCATQELAEEFLALADSFGYSWNSGESYLLISRFCGEETCYCISEGTYGEIEDFNCKKIVVFLGENPKSVREKMIDLFLKEYGFNFDEEFESTEIGYFAYKISKNYEIFCRPMKWGHPTKVEALTVLGYGGIKKVVKKTTYNLTFEQETMSSCYQCMLCNKTMNGNRVIATCMYTDDFVGNLSIPDNCPLEKVAEE